MQLEQIILARLKIYDETQTIASQLPINIDGFEIAELLMTCGDCHQSIPSELIHGYATKPLENAAHFRAIFICNHCRSVAESVQRIKKIGKHTIAVDKLTPEGKWLYSEMRLKNDHLLVKLVKLLLGRK